MHALLMHNGERVLQELHWESPQGASSFTPGKGWEGGKQGPSTGEAETTAGKDGPPRGGASPSRQYEVGRAPRRKEAEWRQRLSPMPALLLLGHPANAVVLRMHWYHHLLPLLRLRL